MGLEGCFQVYEGRREREKSRYGKARGWNNRGSDMHDDFKEQQKAVTQGDC